MNTGQVIKELRNKKKLTQCELGKMLGVNTSSIQKYESGATKNLKLETIRELCSIFGVPPMLFVFPEEYESFSTIHKTAFHAYFKKQLRISEEGTEKILAYIDDIVFIEKCKSQEKSR